MLSSISDNASCSQREFIILFACSTPRCFYIVVYVALFYYCNKITQINTNSIQYFKDIYWKWKYVLLSYTLKKLVCWICNWNCKRDRLEELHILWVKITGKTCKIYKFLFVRSSLQCTQCLQTLSVKFRDFNCNFYIFLFAN